MSVIPVLLICYILFKQTLIKYLKNDQEKGRFYFDLGSIYYHYEKYEESKEQFLLSRNLGFPVPKEIFDNLDKKIR